MKIIMMSILVALSVAVAAQSITAITPAQAYRGDSLQTTITSSGLFLTGSSPQNNIQDIFLKNGNDSVIAIADSTHAVSATTATTFWRIPSSIATGLYTLVVRIYNSLFSGPTTDYTLSNAFSITTAVWPGDADNNQIVDNNDLLAIGLGYGTTGVGRPAASIVWQAQSCVDWTGYFTNYAPPVNYKHADCNGDGAINASDTTAIIQNFSLVHAKTNTPATWRSGLPALVPSFDRSTLFNGDTFKVSFLLGDSSMAASHIYGIAFTYNFDALVVDSAFTNVSFANSWLGGSTDKICIAKKLGAQGQIKMALTRIDHITRSGDGSIGYASFKITTDNISGVVNTHYANLGYISDVNIIDSSGRNIPVNAGTDSNTIIHYPNGVATLSDMSVQVLPNPTGSRISITSGDHIREITITNINGQQVWHSATINSKSQYIDMATYGDGLYIVQVSTQKGVRTVKLLVTR